MSIPNSADKTKLKFFMQIEKVGNKSAEGKTLVTISGREDQLAKLNIGEKITLDGSLRKPFSATNPSQFDYSSYLRNFNTFTVLYSDNDNFKINKSKSEFKWTFLKRIK